LPRTCTIGGCSILKTASKVTPAERLAAHLVELLDEAHMSGSTLPGADKPGSENSRKNIF
jgi:hypothetical protein